MYCHKFLSSVNIFKKLNLKWLRKNRQNHIFKSSAFSFCNFKLFLSPLCVNWMPVSESALAGKIQKLLQKKVIYSVCGKVPMDLLDFYLSHNYFFHPCYNDDILCIPVMKYFKLICKFYKNIYTLKENLFITSMNTLH